MLSAMYMRIKCKAVMRVNGVFHGGASFPAISLLHSPIRVSLSLSVLSVTDVCEAHLHNHVFVLAQSVHISLVCS